MMTGPVMAYVKEISQYVCGRAEEIHVKPVMISWWLRRG
jgi:hypothetical protein